MTRLTFCFTFLSLITVITAQAQGTTASVKAPSAVQAYAKSNDSYLLFSNDTYKADKKYVVVKFWNESTPITDTEKAEIDYLKKHLVKKGVEVVDFQWKTTEDLKQNLSKYNFSVEAKGEKRISIKGDNFSLNTTSGKALFVVEDGKPLSLCSGKNCEEMVKTFFKLKTLN